MNHKWQMECKNIIKRLRNIIPDANYGNIGLQLPRTAGVRLNQLRNGVWTFSLKYEQLLRSSCNL